MVRYMARPKEPAKMIGTVQKVIRKILRKK
jgi:hypothetical protein